MKDNNNYFVYLLICIFFLILSVGIYYIYLISKKKISLKDGFISWIKKAFDIFFAGW